MSRTSVVTNDSKFRTFIFPFLLGVLFCIAVVGILFAIFFIKVFKNGMFPPFVYLDERYIEEIKSRYDNFPDTAYRIYYAHDGGIDPVRCLAGVYRSFCNFMAAGW